MHAMGPTAERIARAQKVLTVTERLLEDARMRWIALSETLTLSQRIQKSKPLFIRGAAEDGSATETLREQVRKRLQTGNLPVPTAAVWAGTGTGKLCVICRAFIFVTDVEYEVASNGEGLSAHLPCFFLWREEAGLEARSREADGHVT